MTINHVIHIKEFDSGLILSSCFVSSVNNFSNKSEIMRHRMSIDLKISIKFGRIIIIGIARETQF